MRLVGDISGRPRGERLVAFLASKGIKAELREDISGSEGLGLWVWDEDHLELAVEHFQAFTQAPESAAFDAPTVVTQRPLGIVRDRQRARLIDVRTEVFGRSQARRLPVTFVLLGLCAVLTLLSRVPAAKDLVRLLYFSEFMGREFVEIRAGQVWRLITPVFLHGGLMHLFFNGLWLYQFGRAIEGAEGSPYMAAVVAVFSIVVNTAQYLVLGSPLFLGMSGVVYGLFGYIWMMARYDSHRRYDIPRETVIVMLVWLGICLSGLIPGVANTEHVSGLVIGVCWGMARANLSRPVRRS